MGKITGSRSLSGYSPAHVSIMRWLNTTLQEITSDPSKTDSEKSLAEYRFSNVSIDDVWVENAIPTTVANGKCLVCFSIPSRGFAVLDTSVDPVSFYELIVYFSIPIKQFPTYSEFFNYVKANPGFNQVVKIAESADGKYGIVDNVELSPQERHGRIQKALNNVLVDTVASYEDKGLSLSSPVVGTLRLSRGSFTTTLLELYPLDEILKM